MDKNIFLRRKIYWYLTAIILGTSILFMVFSTLTTRMADTHTFEGYEQAMESYSEKMEEERLVGRQKACLLGLHRQDLVEVLEFQKFEVLECETLEELDQDVELLIVNADCLNDDQTYEQFVTCLNEKRYNVILYGLEKLQFTQEKMDLLGIVSVGNNRTYFGIIIYDGFWKNVSTIEKEYSYTALELEIENGRQVYIAEYEEIEAGEFPGSMPILYRQVVGESELYIVNGPLMKEFPQGIIRGVCSQLREDYLYPIANVSYFVVDSFPVLSDEYKEELNTKYLRGMRLLTEDILLPGVLSLSSSLKQKPTFIARDYIDEKNNLFPDLLTYVEKEVKHWDGELGIRVTEENQDDWSVWREKYLDTQELYTVSSSMEKYNQPYLGRYISNVSVDTKAVVPVGKVSEEAVELYVVYDILEKNAKMRLNYLSSVYGYGVSGLGIDMKEVLEHEKEWSVLVKEAIEKYSPYIYEIELLEKVTASKAAQRVLEFYLMEPVIVYDKECIKVEINYFTGDAEFILRTEKEVERVENGSFEKLADGNWLIRFYEPSGEIFLKESKLVYPNAE